MDQMMTMMTIKERRKRDRNRQRYRQWRWDEKAGLLGGMR
jgi:hypothetical protein